ncbi:MAG TPA: FG-GAP-like repeat-containing protein [Polyangiaceae bacterium]|nr:FG-GAP-like repeat-containing protein [Polyangiaceae bacterium]
MSQRKSLLPRHARSALALVVAFLAPKYAVAVPYFEDVTTTALPDPQPCADSKLGCFTSWATSSDLDGDGDLDIILANGGGYYVPDVAESSTVYFNDGLGKFTDATPTTFGGAKSRLRQVAIGDVDGDGDQDMYAPGGFGIDLDKLWIQTAPGVFEDKAAELLPPGLMSNTPGFHLGDLDGDGDLDLVTTDWFTAGDRTPVFLTLYLNDGTGKFSVAAVQKEAEFWTKGDRFPPRIPFAAAAGVPYWGTRAIDLDFADIDGDFDLDILVNMRNGISRILLNDGAGFFSDGNGKVYNVSDPAGGTPLTVSNYPMKRGPYVYNQELCDFDNDGDLDMLLDNAGLRPVGGSSNYTQVLVNNGSGVFADETRARIFGETGSDDNAVKCVDVNNDGNYDLLVATLTGQAEKLLISDGAGKFNAEADGFPKIRDSTLGIEAGDFDGDGVFDVFTGQGEGGSFVDRLYRGVAPGAADTRPPKFRKVQTPTAIAGAPLVFHVAVTDSVTSETGEMVKDVSVVYLGNKVSGKVKAKFIGGDLFRVEIPAQAVYTTVTLTPQATDRAGNKGFATPISVFVLPAPVAGGDGGAAGAPGGEGGMAGTPTGEGGMPSEPGGDGGTPSVEPGMGGTPGTEPEPGAAGMMTSEPEGGMSSGATSGTGGSTTPSEGGAPAEGGVSSTPSSPGKKSGDDDGCTVAAGSASGSSVGFLAAMSLLLAAGLRRRQRGQ